MARRPKFKGIKGKIGYCDQKDLPFKANSGHYVYIRKYDKKNGMCTVSTCTSIEKNNQYRKNKIDAIRDGNLYPIPRRDTNFPLWTGVNRTSHQVHKSKIKNIGAISFKNRHHFIIGKNK